jgi:HK97 family phage prohead protease
MTAAKNTGIKGQAARDKMMIRPNITVPLEIKGLNSREFEGHGSVFNNTDYGGDIVMPGAFKRSLAQYRKSGTLPAMFWMHNSTKVPGKWLEMGEDKIGLSVKGVLAKTELGNETHELLTMKAVRGMSIGYQTVDQDYDKDGNRLLKEVDLWEVSVVSLAMNPLAQVTHIKTRLSERGEYVPSIREFESALRDTGCSWDVSKRIITKVYEDELRNDAPYNDPDSYREGEQDALKAAELVYENLIISRIQSIFTIPV